MRVVALTAAAVFAHVTYADQSYTQCVMQQYAQRQQGNVGAIAMTSDGDVASSAAPGATMQVSSSTVFEVGSTTKTFTTLAAEALAGQGKLAMTDTISKYVNVTLAPTVGDITLVELATHTSGLARMPSNIDPRSPDPMHAYTYKDLYQYLGSLTEVGPKKFLYSNTGFGLLGFITVIASGKSWESLVKELVLQPIGMTDTAVTLSSDQQGRLAPPYSNGAPSGPTTFTDAMVGAGGLRSTASDMLKFSKAFAGLSKVPADLRASMDRMLKPHAADEFADLRGRVDEAFQQYTLREANAVWKDGATSGYNCYIAFVANKSATFVAANTAAISADSATALAANLILAGPQPARTVVQVPSSTLQSYAGSYSQAAGPHGPPVQYLVTAEDDALAISSAAAPTVLVQPFRSNAFFTQQTYLESYVSNGDLIMFYSGQDHYAQKGAVDVTSSPPSSSYEDWLFSRSFDPIRQPVVSV